MHYLAFIEPGPKNYSVYFPDLPGCTSAGDTLDETIANAGEALAFHVSSMLSDGDEIPRPRTLEQIRSDPEYSRDLRDVIVVAVPISQAERPAAAE
jgi:predicted RNase H-like HicB family nuclease